MALGLNRKLRIRELVFRVIGLEVIMKAVYIRDFPKGEKNRVGTCFQYCLWLGIWKENQ